MISQLLKINIKIFLSKTENNRTTVEFTQCPIIIKNYILTEFKGKIKINDKTRMINPLRITFCGGDI